MLTGLLGCLFLKCLPKALESDFRRLGAAEQAPESRGWSLREALHEGHGPRRLGQLLGETRPRGPAEPGVAPTRPAGLGGERRGAVGRHLQPGRGLRGGCSSCAHIALQGPGGTEGSGAAAAARTPALPVAPAPRPRLSAPSPRFAAPRPGGQKRVPGLRSGGLEEPLAWETDCRESAAPRGLGAGVGRAPRIPALLPGRASLRLALSARPPRSWASLWRPEERAPGQGGTLGALP